MHAVRRTHLYFGLFLLPWAVLYGITGFLFNHPSAFADAPTVTFGKSELSGTPMESLPKPETIAAEVVTALNERAKDGKPYSLVEPEKVNYTRDFAFAIVKTEGTEVNILFDVNNPGGTVRARSATPVVKSEEKAPFAIGPGRTEGDRPARNPKTQTTNTSHANNAGPLRLADPLHERVKTAVPVVLERTGFPTGDVTVTSVPDLSFHMSDGTKTWRVTYNAMTGTVSGTPVDNIPPPEELSTRQFLTRLHKAHGFPGGTNAKWFWAVLVDAMSFVMVFWGVSGIFMWWQIKATRKLGFFLLLLSVAATVALGLGMHEVFTMK
jgi:hypothetical protein